MQNNQENLFRFFSLRSSTIEHKDNLLNVKIGLDNKYLPIFKEIKHSKDSFTEDKLKSLLANLKDKNKYVDALDNSEYSIDKLFNWLKQNSNSSFVESKFEYNFVSYIFSKDNLKFEEDHLVTFFENLNNSLFVDILLQNQISDKEEKIRLIKIIYAYLQLKEKGKSALEEMKISEYLSNSYVIFPTVSIAHIEELNNDIDKVIEKKNFEPKKLYQETVTAYDEIKRLLSNRDFFKHEGETTETESKTVNKTSEVPGRVASFNSKQNFFEFTDNNIELITEQTCSFLNQLQINYKSRSIFEVLSEVEKKYKIISSENFISNSHDFLTLIGDNFISKKQIRESITGPSKKTSSKTGDNYSKPKFEVGIGDLLIVKQNLKAYELGDFAHIENALTGEYKERIHKRLDSTEVIKSTVTETEIEKEKDLQSTDRNELQLESEKIIKEQSQTSYGVQATASYGPSLSITASLNSGFSSSISNSQKQSINFSKEVSTKASEKVRNKVTEQQTRKTLAQIEETNIHRIDNSNKKNTRGVYRWLNKIYDAQVFQYGKRMMYEFVIPEPASFYLYAIADNININTDLIKPLAPTFNKKTLSPNDINRFNYLEFVRDYNVIGVDAPPSQFKIKSLDAAIDNTKNTGFKLISIDSGYRAKYGLITYLWDYDLNDTTTNGSLRIFLGGTYQDMSYKDSIYGLFEINIWNNTDSISFSYHNLNLRCKNLNISIDLVCEITEEEEEKWKLKVYNSILQAYLDQKAAYEAKLEEYSIQKGVTIQGNNPLKNRKIEKDEFKKWIFMILSKSNKIDFNSFMTTSIKEPTLDLNATEKNGKIIRFIENAFEWENILYSFYSYFWGRYSTWNKSLMLSDTDPNFEAFLNAGAARVQLAVRPNFEKAVAYFCETGIPWEGNDVPVIGDSLYVPIINEITESLNKPGDEKPYPKDSHPWDVVIPTSLVVLQDISEIPKIKDSLTGKDINIKHRKTLWQKIFGSNE